MTSTQIIIGITGEKGSGKGTAAHYIMEKYGAQAFRFSKILDDVLARLYLLNARENQIKLALSFRANFGDDILARVLLQDATKSDHELMVIEGIRYWDELNILKQHPFFYLISITATPEVRHERCKNRGEKAGEKDQTFEQFMEEEKKPTELMIRDIAKTSNFKLDNNRDFEGLDYQIDVIMKKIISKGS